ncbi:hypothetical protein Pfo_031545 [Paulownia fortunei]|nr:hypothetical protein Pfo_031545 [Paulownia fortunei]
MDRLLVGDVGFGKTEVALRAVFKAAHAGKQVAFLAPTTILVQQHYETMKARFDDFPEIRIGVLSRFQTPSQNKAVISQLKAHELDVVVGTHRLLSQDVNFADLGLLIIDEEQRFGVKHKERLKQLRTSVDVLTLTATPIPRTLNMAMVGARDLSVIETPPANRYPIQTYVMEADWTVYVMPLKKKLHVMDKSCVVSQIEDIVPSARVAAIHGQIIRGAGDLLGKQQHGFIDSVGYDMYTQMLKDTVAQKQGRLVTGKTEPNHAIEKEARIFRYDFFNAIQQAAQRLGKQITEDYARERPLFLSVLKGAYLWTADLIREVDLYAELEFIKISSYHGGREQLLNQI